VLLYAFAAPYLYLFVPRERRSTGAKLLIWIWAPAAIAGAMTAYTSAAGYVNASVGLASSTLLSGLFLAWALEAVAKPTARRGETMELVPSLDSAGLGGAPGASRKASAPWLALCVLIAVIGVTVSFQFQFQQRDVAYGELTSRFDSGPWWGIKVTPERRHLLDDFAADLRAQGRPDDELLVYYEGCGYYLFWRGAIASSAYWVASDPSTGQLHRSVISYYRRHRVVPTLLVHLIKTGGLTNAELQEGTGGLYYPPTLVRPDYVFHRKPADESTAEVLARLPRE